MKEGREEIKCLKMKRGFISSLDDSENNQQNVTLITHKWWGEEDSGLKA
jgi:hypothetical protein